MFHEDKDTFSRQKKQTGATGRGGGGYRYLFTIFVGGNHN
jgi:hypothetical protein